MRMTFTKRDLEIIEQVGKGRSLKQIAEKAGAKEETVRDQADQLKAKLTAGTIDEIPGRFVEVTGWANPPTQYTAVPEG
jgi:DNA-binding NarL/FixJ family response regulator